MCEQGSVRRSSTERDNISPTEGFISILYSRREAIRVTVMYSSNHYVSVLTNENKSEGMQQESKEF